MNRGTKLEDHGHEMFEMVYDLWMGPFLQCDGPMSAAELDAKKKRKLKEKCGML